MLIRPLTLLMAVLMAPAIWIFRNFTLFRRSGFSYHQALQIAIEVYTTLKAALKRRQAIHSVGDEGGFAPDLFTNLDALEVITKR